MQSIHPYRLSPGDTIGIVSPSGPVAAFCPRRLKRGIEELEKRGFRVKLGKHVSERRKYVAGTIEQRLEDLHAMFADSEVKAVISTIGGLNANQLLDGIDYDLIKANPKIFMGFSDITVLLNAVHAKTGLTTYLGPALLPQFGEFGGTLPFTWSYMEKIFMGTDDVRIEASKEWTDELTMWDKEDDRPRVMKPNPGIRTLKPGNCFGRIVGGNVGAFLLLAGTPYMPDLEGKILLAEEDEVETPSSVDRLFTHLRAIGTFGKISGLLVGRFHSKVGFTEENSVDDIILTATRGYDFPILTDLDFGHTDPMITFPIGGQCSVDASSKQVVLSDFIQ